MFDPEIHHRRSIRLRGYDYAAAGYYFITICVQHKASLLGTIIDGEMLLNDAARMVEYWWQKIPDRFPNVAQDEHIIMPNHFHGIIILHASGTVGADPRVCPGSKIDAGPGNAGGHTGPGNAGGHMGPGNAGGHMGPGNAGGHMGPGNAGGHTGPGNAGGHMGPPLPRVIQWFKTMTTNAYIHSVKQNNWPPFNGRFWQRNYYERIIRNDQELQNIRQYIQNNPINWGNDNERPTPKP